MPMAAVAEVVAKDAAAADGRRICYDRGEIWLGDNLPLLRQMPSASVNLIYIDPPFNTGKTQTRKSIRVRRANAGTNGDDALGRRVGFGGHCYDSVVIGETGYDDAFASSADYAAFLRPRLQEARRLLSDNGSLFFHIDWRESARCRLLLEDVFGGDSHCINELIWAYDFGGRGKTRWPAKHDNIYWFAKNPGDYTFNYDAHDRIAYMAPGLVGNEKAARGKTPTDVWWNTIVPTNGKEKTGYATQKPLAIIDRIVRVHSNPGDTVLDFFAGSGTTGIAAINNERKFILMDKNPQAFAIMQKRLAAVLPIVKKTTTTKKMKEKQ